jgi:hypothetical protein
MEAAALRGNINSRKMGRGGIFIGAGEILQNFLCF